MVGTICDPTTWRPFDIWPSESPDLKWFQILKGRILDPHCTNETEPVFFLVTKNIFFKIFTASDDPDNTSSAKPVDPTSRTKLRTNQLLQAATVSKTKRTRCGRVSKPRPRDIDYVSYFFHYSLKASIPNIQIHSPFKIQHFNVWIWDGLALEWLGPKLHLC